MTGVLRTTDPDVLEEWAGYVPARCEVCSDDGLVVGVLTGDESLAVCERCATDLAESPQTEKR